MPRFSVLLIGLFALTLFVSALLLFLLQPMVGKMLLPLLGGTPAVWNTCMVFFQLYFPLNFSGQTSSEAGAKPPVTRFVRLSTCREALQKV